VYFQAALLILEEVLEDFQEAELVVAEVAVGNKIKNNLYEVSTIDIFYLMHNWL
jgi:hypothetical protein